MKSCLFILLAIVAVISYAEDSEDIRMSDEEAMKNIESIFNVMHLNLEGKARKFDFIPKMFLLSIDKKCVMNKYKSHNLFDKISKKNLKMSGWEIQEQWSFFAVTFSCSSMYDALIEYTFENTMTHNILWRALKNDSQLEKYTDIVTCANSYAVENNIWDLDAYKIDYEIGETKRMVCDNNIMEAVETIAANKYIDQLRHIDAVSSTACNKGLFKIAKHFVVKYLLLVQVQLSETQRHHELQNFKKDLQELLRKFLSCVAIQSDI